MGAFDLLAQNLKVAGTTQARGLVGQGTGFLNAGLQVAFGGIIGGTQTLPSQFNIDDFRTNLSAHGELAKADKFDVQFNVPSVVQLASGTTLRELTLQCETSELPSRDINLIEYRHYGFIRRIPHQNQYGMASFTFICAGDMWEKRLFDRWLDVMVPTNSGLVTYPMDNQGNMNYETSIMCNQYNANGNWIYGAQLIDAIPTSISQLSQNWNDDSYHRLTVTFAFRKWLSDSTTAQVDPTDFGSSIGGNVNIKPTGVAPINNMTNNTNPAVSMFENAVGQSVVASVKASGIARFKI